MKYTITCATLAAMLAAMPLAAHAQGKPQFLTKFDTDSVTSGYRASKILGAAIYNESNERVGTVDDLIVSRNDRVPYAIISVGGFLGIGDKLVAVPMENLQFSMDRTLLAGATRDAVRALPEFKYSR